jgi:hypothetical protein
MRAPKKKKQNKSPLHASRRSSLDKLSGTWPDSGIQCPVRLLADCFLLHCRMSGHNESVATSVYQSSERHG